MQINVVYDQSQGSLPAGFAAAVNYVVNYFDTTFTNPVTVNIDLGYGEIDGQSLGSGALGESETYFNSVPYSQAVNALKANQPSASQQAAYSTLPGSSPVSGGTLWVSTAEEKALGLLAGNNSAIDGYVGLSSTYPFSYSAGATPAAGQYYFDGALAHEFSEVLGRGSLLGEGLGGTNSYTIMDLFRYSAPGSRQIGTGGPAYFSIDNGSTNLDSWNTNPNGDLGDWAASAGADAFLAFSPSGQINWITQPDLTLLNVLGYDTVSSQAPVLTVVGTGDFNNNGTSDILFDNSGTIAEWEMNGAQGMTRSVIYSPIPSGWQVVGTGDFNGDQMTDILLQQTDSSVAIWQMSGTQIQSGAVIATPGSGWHVAGTADFNGDLKSDVLLQHTDGRVAIWLMNGTQILSGAIIAAPGSDWRVAGIGDFSGDHVNDIVLQNTNGDVAIWEMNGAQIQSGAVIASPGSTWHVMGTGDFSGDHISDIVLQDTSGRVAIWEMNGTTIKSGTIVGSMTSDWHFEGIGDFNGDHTSDILWQNNNGALEIWEMNGTQVTSAQVSPPAGAPIGGAHPLTDGPSNTTPLVAGTQGKLDQSVALLSQYMASAFTPSGFGDSASPVVDPTAASPGQTPFLIQPAQDHPRQG